MKSLKEIIEEITSGIGFYNNIDAIGRKTVPNVDELFIGLNDKKGAYLYFRFDGDNDFEVSSQNVSAEKKSFYISSTLTAIIVARCNNIEDIAIRTAGFLANSGFNVTVSSIDTDSQRIFEEETPEDSKFKSNTVRLARINFVLSYRVNKPCGNLDDLVCDKCK